MKNLVIIKEFLNEKEQRRYLIEDISGIELHRAGGAGFKTVGSAEDFAKSHQWIAISIPKHVVMAGPLF